MGKEKETKQEPTGIILGKAKEIKKKYPAYVKYIFGLAAALLIGAVGFFGGIFGLNSDQQNKIKQVIISSTVYQAAIADEPVTTVEQKPAADAKTTAESTVEKKAEEAKK